MDAEDGKALQHTSGLRPGDTFAERSAHLLAPSTIYEGVRGNAHRGQSEAIEFARHFWYWRDIEMLGRSRREHCLYLSVRVVATLASTRAHCFQSQGPLLQKHLSQLRNEQVGAAVLFESRESWPSLRVPTTVATAAAQSGVPDTTVAAQTLQQNESEKVEQPVAEL